MIFNPLDKNYKSVYGAVPAGEKLTFRVKAQEFCTLAVYSDDVKTKFYPMQKEGDFYKTEISFSRGLYFYYFITESGELRCGKDYCGEYGDNLSPFQLTVYSKDYRVPKWIKGGIIYQIFPDRFYRAEKSKPNISGRILRDDWGGTPEFMPNEKGIVKNNDFFGGDLKGIIKKLPYLKSLSIRAIYLNPIFKASSNHRYDTGDYMKIDPFLGSEKDFKALIKKADEYGIKIILDGVFNHTGDDSIYFNKYGNYDSVGAYQSKESKYYSWYDFKDYPNEYNCWWGIKILPTLNKNSKEYVNFITGKDGVIEKYTKMGIGGWRFDVVDELPDFMVKKIRKAVKNINSDAFMIGEVWEDATDKIAYGVRREYFQGKELDSVMNYPLKNAIIDFVLNKRAEDLSYLIKSQCDRYPKTALNALMNVLATHDTFRLLSALGDDVAGKTKSDLKEYVLSEKSLKTAIKRLKTAVLLSYTLPGVPSVYYGDEIGMQGYKDPLNRRCFSWDNKNTEILSWYKKLGRIRSLFSAFTDGEYKEICAKDGFFAFKRTSKNSEVLICVNLSADSVELNFDGKLKNLIDGKTYNNGAIILPDQNAVFINA